MEFDLVSKLITDKITDAKVQVTDLTGTKDHLGLLIISEEFKGKRLLQQHQMIMDILRESLKEQIHAVQIKTMTPEQAQQQGVNL